MSAGRNPAHLLFSSCYLWTFSEECSSECFAEKRLLSSSRHWVTKRSSCVLIDWPQVGCSGPRSSHWGSRLRSIGRQWQRKQASFILWRWSSVDRDQSAALTLINSITEERLLHDSSDTHMKMCVCLISLFLFSCGCPSSYLPWSLHLYKTKCCCRCSHKQKTCISLIQQRPDSQYWEYLDCQWMFPRDENVITTRIFQTIRTLLLCWIKQSQAEM